MYPEGDSGPDNFISAVSGMNIQADQNQNNAESKPNTILASSKQWVIGFVTSSD